MLSELMLRVWAWFHREEGQDLIEYALVTALISVAIITAVALTPLGSAFDTWAQNVADAIT
jgi:Flp pilus assembly pilin Flp